MSSARNTHLTGLATATPENILPQNLALEIARDIFADSYEEFDRLAPVFTNSGINQRFISKPIDWYLEPLDWHKRTEAFLEVGTRLFCDATHKALAQSNLKAGDIDTIITVTSTGIATPSLEARASEYLGFRPDCVRIPIFGLGCAGGVTGLSIATELASARPDAKILVVIVELCSITFRMDKLSKANIVATALFGDGAAAAIVTCNPDHSDVVLGVGCQHTWPDTLNIMGWNVEPEGLEVVFDRSIPLFARRNLNQTLNQFFERLSISRDSLDRLSFHPGGAKVLEAIETSLDIEAGSLDIEREVLKEFGNMSAPTALFVLEKVLGNSQKSKTNHSLLTALGPGFTASCIPVAS